MRHKDGAGPYMVHPDDPRLMRRADPQKGEAGGYALYWEGTDNDSDGFYNEDPAGGIDLNRNFQHKYPYYQPDAGPHMISEAETRGVMDYVLARRNIAAILTFGESDNLIAPPGRRGEQGPASTIDLIAFAFQFANLGRRGDFPRRLQKILQHRHTRALRAAIARGLSSSRVSCCGSKEWAR